MKQLNNNDYLNMVKLYYDKYIRNNAPMPQYTDVVNPDIWESWKRAKKYGVDPNFISSNAVSSNEFKQILEDNKTLLDAAQPYVHSLYDFVRGSNYVMHLTDRNGCLLKYYADDIQIQNLFKKTSLLKEGAIRTEFTSGTDSSSLCLAIDKPIQVIGAEHYLERNHAFFCSSSPIHDVSGQLIGCLTMMGPVELYQSHTLGMVYSATCGIELELKNTKYYHQLTATNALLDTAIDSLNDGIVVIDTNQKILQYNRKFAEILTLPSGDHKGKSLFSILSLNSFPKKARNFNEAKDNISFTATNILGDAASVFLSIKPILSDNNEVLQTMLIFKEERQMHEIVKEVGNLKATYTFDSIVGNSQAISETKALGKTAANSNSNVLIIGESGTGKELLAQSIHNASNRRNGPFVTINCGSIPKNLIESELFGYESGSFTGAKQDGHPGKFELADGGTLFLDEIGDMPLELQASLLRVLQSHEIVRIGGKYPKYIDVRIIAATNVDLINAVNNRTFRNDLFYRLNVLNIILPPLRKRKNDIPLLADLFIDSYSKALGKSECSLSRDALFLMKKYDWPGNIRELENTIERAINIIPGNIIEPEHLPDYIINNDQSIQFIQQTMPVYQSGYINSSAGFMPSESISPLIKEREKIIDLLQKERGHVNSVAQRLNIPTSTLYRKLKKFNINAKDYKTWF